ncbi:MAG: adenylate/guanylate cyclase domain-containing protein [Spirochaetia bacterium]|nr:adenylate/guanylate cyclase domain-containing protein [Spirochaetia bacterium]
MMINDNEKILLLDQDDRLLNELKQSEVSQLNYQISSESSHFIEQIQAWQPGILLINAEIVQNPTDLFEKIKKINNGKADIIISCETNSNELKNLCHKYEIYDYIFQPVFLPEITNKIKSKVRQREESAKLTSLNQKLKFEHSILAKYFSDDLVEKLLNEEISAEFGGTNLQASILFFDLRNSTSIAEKIEPALFSEFLSEIFTDTMDLIYGNKGSVNKMLGDGLLATFGCPVASDDDPFNCVKTAIQIQDYLRTYNDVKPDYLKEDVRAGIGISTGNVFAGNIGSVRRMEYTVLGDPVNLASRLESLTKETGFNILMDDTTYEIVKNRTETMQIDHNEVRGKEDKVSIYALNGILE